MKEKENRRDTEKRWAIEVKDSGARLIQVDMALVNLLPLCASVSLWFVLYSSSWFGR